MLLMPLRSLAWGETTSYVLDQANEVTLNTISTGPALALSGPGATLTFQARRQTAAASYFFVEQSTNGGSSWSELANPSLGTSYSSYSYTIASNVTHIRFRTKTGATLKKYYKNVKVTRATTLSTSATELDFGTVTNRKSATLNAVIDYNNTTYNQQVTGNCTDGNFTVTATTVGATGEGLQIPVIFSPTRAGAHSGTVTLKMNGKTVTFTVKGVGQTTYYTRATASATAGGSAYVSFTSFDAATNSNATTNSGVTTAANATTTAYYRAVAAQRYTFVGWKRNLSDANYVSTDVEFQAPSYTYDSESSGSPTVVTYYAVFEEKPSAVTLEPTADGYDVDYYEHVTLHRTFAAGYSTLSLPFATTVEALTGRSAEDDWVAQLSCVTYNPHDGYTLFFDKVTSGHINACEPYILHLGQALTDPSWTNIDLHAATSQTLAAQKGYSTAASPDGSSYEDWTMTSNFTAAFSMSGLLGIVNGAGALMRGSSSAVLNAFTAYITAPAGAYGVKMQSAFTDEWGRTTYIDSLPVENGDATTEGVFDISGRRIDHVKALPRGIYVSRGRKVIVR